MVEGVKVGLKTVFTGRSGKGLRLGRVRSVRDDEEIPCFIFYVYINKCYFY